MMFPSKLPLDLESEILSRVPTECLAQVQTTCKPWYLIFKDPVFVKNNMGTSARESILLMNSKVHSVSIDHVICDERINAAMAFKGTLTSRKKSQVVNVSEIFYCNGLVLCSSNRNKKVVVWNPCNGEIRSIKTTSPYSSDDYYALGYDKILRCNLGGTVAEFEMYAFSSDSWRVLHVDTHDWEIRSPGVSLRGNAYWIAKDKVNEDDFFILTFNFATERFKRLRLPDRNDGPTSIQVTAVLSVVRDEKLSVLHQYHHKKSLKMKKMEIWMSNNIETKEVSWSNFLEVNLRDFPFELGTKVQVVSFLVDEEHKVVVCCSLDVGRLKEKTRVFIVGEGKLKQVYQGTRLENTWLILFDYVPSLAHIHKNKPNHKRKRQEPKIVLKPRRIAYRTW